MFPTVCQFGYPHGMLSLEVGGAGALLPWATYPRVLSSTALKLLDCEPAGGLLPLCWKWYGPTTADSAK